MTRQSLSQWANASLTALILPVLVAAAPVPWPEHPAAVPGWVGLATRAKSGTDPYTPTVAAPDSLAVPGEWGKGIAGARFVAYGAGGQFPLTFRRGAMVPYGCDKIPTAFGLFASAKPLAEGPYLVVPAVVSAMVQHVPLTRLALAAVPGGGVPAALRQAKSLAGWQAGSSVFRLVRPAPDRVDLAVLVAGRIVYEQHLRKTAMAGDDSPGVDLSTLPQVQVPTPALAFRGPKPDQIRFVTVTPGYEGVGFSAYGPQGATEISSLYQCAF